MMDYLKKKIKTMSLCCVNMVKKKGDFKKGG